ncbi:MAG: VOC family protein [Gemmatimonadota bacterium]
MQIDHVELFVPDRREAAAWFRRVLGLQILPEHEPWAKDSGGPLMISSDGGSTKLALFEGTPPGDHETAGYHRVAFRVSADELRSFLIRLPGLELTDHLGRRVTKELLADHRQAYSLYFCDPFGHRLELTSYEHEEMMALLADLPDM